MAFSFRYVEMILKVLFAVAAIAFIVVMILDRPSSSGGKEQYSGIGDAIYHYDPEIFPETPKKDTPSSSKKSGKPQKQAPQNKPGPSQKSGNTHIKPEHNIKHYDVLLTSYMRSGSTLTGSLLGWRQDSFYFYEPLWKIARWAFYSGNSTVCRSDRPECINVPRTAVPGPGFVQNKDDGPGHSLNNAMEILNRAFDCKFDNFENLVVDDKVIADLGGGAWEGYRQCRTRKKSVTTCLAAASISCRKSSHRVAKVLRLTVDNAEALLKRRPNLKVIHLFRDPRAVMNSRIETKWFPMNSTQKIYENANILCRKMLYDYYMGLSLRARYPGRFRFVYYEDLSTQTNGNPLEKVKDLFRYLGMSLEEDKFRNVRDIPTFNADRNEVKSERAKNNAFWWRKSLDWPKVQKIDKICAKANQVLGYQKFSSEKKLRNLAYPSVMVKKENLIIPPT